MYRFALLMVLLLEAAFLQAKAPTGWSEGKIVPGKTSDQPTVIYLEDGTKIKVDSTSDVFAKLLHHWSIHQDHTVFYYQLRAKYNNLQEFKIRYFVNAFGGIQLSGTHPMAPELK